MRKENELPEDFMVRMGTYFSETARMDYLKVAEEIVAIRKELAALKEAARPVVWAWKIHGYEEYPSDALIAALDALATLAGEGRNG